MITTTYASGREIEGISRRSSGSVLLVTVVLSVLIMGFAIGLHVMSMMAARYMRSAEAEARSIVLAESGLQAALYEIYEGTDLEGNGIGTVAHSMADGSYSVFTEEIAADHWRLTSTGTSDTATVTIVLETRKSPTSGFPAGAVAIVGDALHGLDLSFEDTADLTFSGGADAAWSLGNNRLVNEVGGALTEAIDHGDLDAASLLGARQEAFNYKGTKYNLSISTDPCGFDMKPDLAGVYQALVDSVYGSLIPSASQLRSDAFVSEQIVLGTATSPVTAYVSDPIELRESQTLSGHGTLVVSELKVLDGAEISWDGTIIVTSESSKAKLEIKGIGTDGVGSRVAVDGNLVILGMADEEGQLKLENDVTLDVDGSMLLAASFGAEGKKAKVEVRQGANLYVHGLWTMIADVFEMKFESSTDVALSGPLQVGFPNSSEQQELKMGFKGNFEVYNLASGVRRGVEALRKLSGELAAPVVGETLTKEGEATIIAWQILSGS